MGTKRYRRVIRNANGYREVLKGDAEEMLCVGPNNHRRT